MVDSKGWNLFLWIVITIAAMIAFGAWGFLLAIGGGLIAIWDWDKNNNTRR